MSDQQAAVQAAVRNDVVAAAQSVPQLVEAARLSDPDLFAALKGMPAWHLYGPPATGVVSWLAGRYGLGWDAGTCSGIALFLVTAGTGLVHAIKPTPVANLPSVKVLLFGLLAGLSLSACATATTSAAVGTAIVAGQLFCAAQPGIVRLVNASGHPVSVIGRTAEDVALLCAAIGGSPVPPPLDPAAAPVESTPAIF
jgi:hypothetical protein